MFMIALNLFHGDEYKAKMVMKSLNMFMWYNEHEIPTWLLYIDE